MTKERFSNGFGFLIAEATLDETQVRGDGGAYWPRLVIPVQLDFSSARDNVDYYFRGLYARLRHQNIGLIAEAIPVRLHHIQRHGWTPGQSTAYPEFILDHRRIAQLEMLRDGKDLTLTMEISLDVEEHGVIEGNEKAMRPWGLRALPQHHVQMRFTVPRSIWIERVLNQIGHGIVHIVELPAVPVAAAQAMQHSFDALRQAQALHAQGLYDESVAKCRIALEPFFDQVPVDPAHKDSRRIPELKKSWETKLGKATYDWLNGCLVAIKSAANPTAHSPNVHFDQFQSQMLQAITTTVIAYAARTLSSDDTK